MKINPVPFYFVIEGELNEKTSSLLFVREEHRKPLLDSISVFQVNLSWCRDRREHSEHLQCILKPHSKLSLLAFFCGLLTYVT